MSRFKPYFWQATIKKCPHCENVVNLQGESKVSEQCAVTDVFYKIEDHMKNKCITGKVRKETELNIMTRSTYDNSTMSEWRSDKMLL